MVAPGIAWMPLSQMQALIAIMMGEFLDSTCRLFQFFFLPVFALLPLFGIFLGEGGVIM
jgi:hypothetical protein